MCRVNSGQHCEATKVIGHSTQLLSLVSAVANVRVATVITIPGAGHGVTELCVGSH